MSKHFLWVLILGGCQSAPGPQPQKVVSKKTDSIPAIIPEKKDSVPRRRAKLFDNRRPFQIVSVKEDLLTNTTDTDTAKCRKWKLTNKNISYLLKNTGVIDATTLDLSFSNLTCVKVVTIIQDGQEFKVDINAGGYFVLRNADTVILYGNYDHRDQKLFVKD